MTLYRLYETIEDLMIRLDTDSAIKVYLWVGGGDGQYTPIFPANNVIIDTINGEEVVVIKV